MKVRMAISVLVAGGAMVGGMVPAAAAVGDGVTGQRAAAAVPHCYRVLTFLNPTRYALVPAAAGLDCQMGRGASGDHVRSLQISLNRCHGYDAGPHDGIYGPKTEAAVKRLQVAKRLEDDGIYGPKTRVYVNWLFSDGSCGLAI